jgi:hypothetical protein
MENIFDNINTSITLIEDMLADDDYTTLEDVLGILRLVSEAKINIQQNINEEELDDRIDISDTSELIDKETLDMIRSW